jgi:hypothetical protein
MYLKDMDCCNESITNKNAICNKTSNRKSASSFITTMILMIILVVTIATSSLSLSYSNALALSKSVSLQPAVVRDNNNNSLFLKFLAQERLLSFLLPNTDSSGVISSSNNNDFLNNIPVTDLELIALTQPVLPVAAATTIFPFIPTVNPGIITTSPTTTIAANPLLLTANQQLPFIQGSSTNGFVSFLCSTNTVQTPSPSALSFQTSTFGSINPLLFPTLTTTTTTTSSTAPTTGTVTLSNSFGGPNLSGQINSGQIIGNSFILQGSLTSGGIANTLLSGGLSGFCNTLGSSNGGIITTIPLLSAFNSNQFTIAGTCGTNVPLSFTIDRIIVGAYIANISCNNII